MNTNSEHILSFYIVLFIQFFGSFGVTTHSSSGRRIRTLRPIAREERTKMDERKILKSLFSPHFHFYVFSLRRFSNENFEQTFLCMKFPLKNMTFLASESQTEGDNESGSRAMETNKTNEEKYFISVQQIFRFFSSHTSHGCGCM